MKVTLEYPSFEGERIVARAECEARETKAQIIVTSGTVVWREKPERDSPRLYIPKGGIRFWRQKRRQVGKRLFFGPTWRMASDQDGGGQRCQPTSISSKSSGIACSG